MGYSDVWRTGAGMPPHPTRSAFIRASTLSLGSIAFGSLIVAILELIRMILNYAQANAAADGSCESPLVLVTLTPSGY